ncbi:ATP/GTP-binding protein [Streptomyces spectabilis]|uniref:ATP/GTP-binding protein n=1 Tax=Streptomyces spectabilis TaxID=68270 RepID=A0A516REC5_STRST|nr:ATP/GTP-binding protein [Streptomyces spectabilis]QDQ13998.1 ATP/GTP-binding protein [Streptomyces spectabilis]
MDSDSTRHSRRTHATPLSRPPAPPPSLPQGNPVPPVPSQRPTVGLSVREWLDEPRPQSGLGVWRFGYVARRGAADRERLRPVTIIGLVIPILAALFLWSVWRRGGIPYQGPVLRSFTPDEWWWGGTVSTPRSWEGFEAKNVYNGVFFGALVYGVLRLGSVADVVRHHLDDLPQPKRAGVTALAALVTLTFVWPEAFPLIDWDPLPIATPVLALITLVTGGYEVWQSELVTYGVYALITAAVLWPFMRLGDWWQILREWREGRASHHGPDHRRAERRHDNERVADPTGLPSQWPQLRAMGQDAAADVLARAVARGSMNDVDCARIQRVWERMTHDPARVARFAQTVLDHGGAAWTHPSGARDLPLRTASHDIRVGQVRIGQYAEGDRVPVERRGAGVALEPSSLATSLLAVGPSGSGKTRYLVRPVTESLTLQALTGHCAVVAVAAAGTQLGPDSSFDVVVRPGDPESTHDLDLYAGVTDPDEAAGFLAEGLIGDLDTVDSQRAATALAQVLGPYVTVHGRFPTVLVLRELVDGTSSALSELCDALRRSDQVGAAAMLREVEARVRQIGTPSDPGPALADRLALLDRPLFADFFGAGTRKPFSLSAVAHHPLRVRFDLPAKGHDEASRMLTRLLLAQFTHLVRVGGERPHFAFLVLDDATGSLTEQTVRGIQQLRSRKAGVMLTLRTVADVPERLHGPLYSVVGCRTALSGVTTWDGRRFTESWGTEWVETREVAKHAVFAHQPMTRAIHSLRKFLTGRAVTTDAVTVRQVERERWSASELAHAVPPGHAVLSLTDVRGEHAPPLLVDLRS